MKSEIFSQAITNRNRIRFYYGPDEVVLDPYYITTTRNGKKIIYGRPFDTENVTKYEYGKIANIKVLMQEKFAPKIPILISHN